MTFMLLQHYAPTATSEPIVNWAPDEIDAHRRSRSEGVTAA